MSWVITLVFISLLSFIFCDQKVTFSKCKYPSHTDNYSGVDAVNALMGQNFSSEDSAKQYKYYFRICDKPADVPADDGRISNESGLVQYEIKEKRSVTIGKFTSADVIQGSGWLLLKYENGDTYNVACDKAHRSASIMLICPNNATETPVFRVIEENTKRVGSSCYYLFELEHPGVCPYTKPTNPSKPSTSMSSLTVFILIFVSCVLLYLCVGMAYKRLAFGSRGCGMVPNNRMWQKIGAKFADGCEWLCRCRNCDGNDRPYLPASHPVHSMNNGNNFISPPPALVLAHDDLTAPGYNHFDITEQSQSNYGVSNLSSDEGDLYRDDQLLQL